MSKLNYGPKWGTSVVSAHYETDEVLERDMNEDRARLLHLWGRKPQYLHELASEKACNTKRRKKAALGTGRQDAELRMADALRDAVTLLEFHMADMMSHKILPGEHSSVNQLQIANALFHLKHKCGVGFDDESYAGRVPLYEHEPQLFPQRDANLDARIKAQREARIRRQRYIIDKLIARPKKGKP